MVVPVASYYHCCSSLRGETESESESENARRSVCAYPCLIHLAAG